MLAFFSATRIRVMLALAAALVVCLPAIAEAQSSGSVRFRVTNVGFIIGVGGGTGTLTFRGRTYQLQVDGLGAGSLGIAQADLVGTATNLRNASDIVGTYSAAGAGLAVAGGGRVVTLQNSKGVVLNLRGRQAGFQASIGVGGVNITMR